MPGAPPPKKIDFMGSAHCPGIRIFFFFKLYITVLVLPNIKMNPPQVYMCSPSWTLLPPPSPYHPSESSQCTSPKHPVSCIEPGLATHFIHDILHVSMPFSQIFPPSPSPTESIVIVQRLSPVCFFETSWIVACQVPLSTVSQSLFKFMSIELARPSNHLILCCLLFLLLSTFPSIRVFSNELALCIRWLKYWSFSFSIIPYNECSGLISFKIAWFDLLAV